MSRGIPPLRPYAFLSRTMTYLPQNFHFYNIQLRHHETWSRTISGHYFKLKNKRPTWCHLLFYFTSYVLNMFRTLICPSSGACDCAVELPHRSLCSRLDVCWWFGATQTQPHQIANTTNREQNDRCGNSTAQSQAPDDGHITYLLTYLLHGAESFLSRWLLAASQEIPRISRNPKVHHRTHKRTPPVPILSQPNQVHMPTSHLLEIHPNIIHPSTFRSPQWSLSLRFLCSLHTEIIGVMDNTCLTATIKNVCFHKQNQPICLFVLPYFRFRFCTGG